MFVVIPTLNALQTTPPQVVDELLAADRAFSVASGKTDVVNGLSAMFGEDILLPPRLHGGGMNLRTADGKETPLKYLAYWQKQAAGWRVTVYKRGQATAMLPLTPMANVLPAAIVEPTRDTALIEQYRKSLADAETAFSDEAQTMGIGPAFTKYGSPDAINLGPPDVPVFIVGNDRIGVGVGGGSQAPSSPVRWSADLKTKGTCSRFT